MSLINLLKGVLSNNGKYGKEISQTNADIVNYDNSISGMTSENIQDAVDEITSSASPVVHNNLTGLQGGSSLPAERYHLTNDEQLWVSGSVWDGTIPFSTFFASNNLATNTAPIKIHLKGTGHTIDALTGVAYANMQHITFVGDNVYVGAGSPQPISILDGVTFANGLPSLEYVDLIFNNSATVTTLTTNVMWYCLGSAIHTNGTVPAIVINNSYLVAHIVNSDVMSGLASIFNAINGGRLLIRSCINSTIQDQTISGDIASFYDVNMNASSGNPTTQSLFLGFQNRALIDRSSEVLFYTESTGITSTNTQSAIDEIYYYHKNKNAIINCDLDVWQRGISFATVADATYTADRMKYRKTASVTAVHTVSQSSDVPTAAQSGHLSNYSLLFTNTTAQASVNAGDINGFDYLIEGFDFNNYVGRKATLSFWVKSSKIGIYCVAFINSGLDRSYVSEYEILAANTWEKKTVTLTFDYSGGTWNYKHQVGLRIRWTFQCGATYQTTANDVWQNGNYSATSSQVNLNDTLGSTLYIAQLQFELGGSATDFEPVLVSDTLARCQRYYEKSYDPGTNPGSATTLGAMYSAGVSASAGLIMTSTVRFAVTKRAITVSGSTLRVYDLNGAINKITTFVGGTPTHNIAPSTVSDISRGSFRCSFNNTGTQNNFGFQWVADAEL